jgi:hypothetical protein
LAEKNEIRNYRKKLKEKETKTIILKRALKQRKNREKESNWKISSQLFMLK